MEMRLAQYELLNEGKKAIASKQSWSIPEIIIATFGGFVVTALHYESALRKAREKHRADTVSFVAALKNAI